METAQAQVLLGTLVAAFRPRDFGEPSEALYLDALVGHGFEAGEAAVRALIRHTDFMPSIHQLVEEIQDHVVADLDALPSAQWTSDDDDQARHLLGERWAIPAIPPHPDWPRFRGTPKPLEDKIDPADVERRRQAARRAKARLLGEDPEVAE